MTAILLNWQQIIWKKKSLVCWGRQELRIVGLSFLLTVAMSVTWCDRDCDTALWWQPLSTKRMFKRIKQKNENLQCACRCSAISFRAVCAFSQTAYTFTLSIIKPVQSNKTNWKRNHLFFRCEDICHCLLQYPSVALTRVFQTESLCESVAAVSAIICPLWAEECESPMNVASELPQKSGRTLAVWKLFILFFEMEECPGKGRVSKACLRFTSHCCTKKPLNCHLIF